MKHQILQGRKRDVRRQGVDDVFRERDAGPKSQSDTLTTDGVNRSASIADAERAWMGGLDRGAARNTADQPFVGAH